MRPETVPWWRQAQADLESAQRIWEAGSFYAVSWFAQQAVEKGAKALYLEREGVLPPRTHDLDYLGVRLEVPRDIASDLSIINPAFGLVRYPDPTTGDAPVDLVDDELAAAHLAAAGRVLTWLEAEFDRRSNQP